MDSVEEREEHMIAPSRHVPVRWGFEGSHCRAARAATLDDAMIVRGNRRVRVPARRAAYSTRCERFGVGLVKPAHVTRSTMGGAARRRTRAADVFVIRMEWNVVGTVLHDLCPSTRCGRLCRVHWWSRVPHTGVVGGERPCDRVCSPCHRITDQVCAVRRSMRLGCLASGRLQLDSCV